MSDRACWVVACVAFHGWMWLLWVDAAASRCWAAFAMTVVWTVVAGVKTLDRKGVFE